MSSAPESPRPPGYVSGDTIGKKYRLKRVIGEGGMGSVWIAENVDLAADVALKLIRADVAEPGADERFLGEARLAARLKHPAIVSVFDFGKTEREEPFIVMELLQGETLGHYLSRQGTVEPGELLRILLPIIDALHLAHGHNVVHRDLKPDNIFISRNDSGEVQPKLLDFGIAKLRGTSAFKATKLTQAGTLIGSPDYMSPEQARGEADLDARSDVWALCVLAYECLVGKPPFHGDNYNALLWAIIHDEPVPSTVYQAGDSELWRLLKRGFAKDRADRWNDARQLGEAFARWLESNGIVEDICHRSLHASWLPAERPTRPELVSPFYSSSPGPGAAGADENALPNSSPMAANQPESVAPDRGDRNRGGFAVPSFSQSMAAPAGTHGVLAPSSSEFRATSSSHSALTTPTKAMDWRPHTRSLWFAAIGVATLVASVVLSDADMQPPAPQQVQPLQAAGSQPPVPKHKQPSNGQRSRAEASSPPTRSGSSAADGASSPQSGSNAQPSGSKTLRVRDLEEIEAPPEPVVRKVSPPPPKPKRASSTKARTRRRAKPRAKKKTPPPSSEANEPFDFGI